MPVFSFSPLPLLTPRNIRVAWVAGVLEYMGLIVLLNATKFTTFFMSCIYAISQPNCHRAVLDTNRRIPLRYIDIKNVSPVAC